MEEGGGRGARVLYLIVFSACRGAQIHLGLLESSRYSEGSSWPPYWDHIRVMNFFKIKKKGGAGPPISGGTTEVYAGTKR